MTKHRPRRILLVDDDTSLLVVLAEQLRDDGYDVATARDGQEALRRLEAGWPDLILLDLMMPRVDGLALARQIKADADLPIIVLSAIDTADSKARLLDEVAEDYVSKPYHYPELRARIERVLRRLGDRIPRQSLVLGPNLTLDLHRRRRPWPATEVQLTPTESRLLGALAANLGEVVADGDAALARLGRHGGGRALVRLGLDAPAAPEDRGRPGPAGPPADRSRSRLPARRGRWPMADPEALGPRPSFPPRRPRRAMPADTAEVPALVPRPADLSV
jgi:DNA-binding response OmpR family regulator